MGMRRRWPGPVPGDGDVGGGRPAPLLLPELAKVAWLDIGLLPKRDTVTWYGVPGSGRPHGRAWPAGFTREALRRGAARITQRPIGGHRCALSLISSMSASTLSTVCCGTG